MYRCSSPLSVTQHESHLYFSFAMSRIASVLLHPLFSHRLDIGSNDTNKLLSFSLFFLVVSFGPSLPTGHFAFSLVLPATVDCTFLQH
ncbi:hypothetical protein BDV18DRAFT_130531 [Aspergillus unguis]